MAEAPLRLVMSCHVEHGTSRGREILFDRSRTEGVEEGLERIVNFADGVGFRMAFALTPAALRALDVDLTGHEVGLHLHPQDAVLQELLSSEIAFATDCLSGYGRNEQKRLLSAGKRVFQETMGSDPTYFVAGNWSENTATLELLIELGFRFDGSPLPGHRTACADWSRVPRCAQPYHPSPADRQIPGSALLLYLPVAQGLWGYYLTPEDIHHVGAGYFCAALREACQNGGGVIHLFLHSPMAVDPFFLDAFAPVVSFALDELKARFVLPTALEAGTPFQGPRFPPAYVAGLNWSLLKSLALRGEFGRRLLSSPSPEAPMPIASGSEPGP